MHQVKIRNGAFKHVESELHHFQETIREIQRLREQILHGTPAEEQVGGRSNLPSSPTEQKGIALASNRKLESMQQIVRTIEYVVSQLPDEKKKLVQLKYWTKPQTLTWRGIAINLNISTRQAMRWRYEIVVSIAELIGWH